MGRWRPHANSRLPHQRLAVAGCRDFRMRSRTLCAPRRCRGSRAGLSQTKRDLVLLAKVAHVGAEPERNAIRLASRAAKATASIAHEIREDGIHLLPVECGQTRQS